MAIYFIETTDGGVKPVEEYVWRKWCENNSRRLAYDTVVRADGTKIEVVTNFLAIDQDYDLSPAYYDRERKIPDDYTPLLYETVTFWLKDTRYRWPSRKTALEGHLKVLAALVRGEALAFQPWTPGKQKPVPPPDIIGLRGRTIEQVRADNAAAERNWRGEASALERLLRPYDPTDFGRRPTQAPPEGAGLVEKVARPAVKDPDREVLADRFAHIDFDDEEKK